ncbi:MAG: hypothetical protein J7L21_02885 [Sulfurimonas sp.]|nr:hypothetical protein [Sulfurimonas sp.]
MGLDTKSLGGGKLYFQEETSPGVYDDMKYFGETKDLVVNFEVETLEHTNTEGESQEIDMEVEIKKTFGMGFFTEDLPQSMVARFFRGSSTSTSQTSGSLSAADIGPVNEFGVYDLGFQSFSAVTLVQDAADTITYVEGTDYSIDLGAGKIEILKDSTIVDASTLHVTGAYDAVTFDVVQAGTNANLSGKFMFLSNPAQGIRREWNFYKTSLFPSGDFALKGTSDWAQAGFTVKVLKDESITVNGMSKYFNVKEIGA